MKICRKEQIIERKNSDACLVKEFPCEDAELNFALIKVLARYPERGLAINRISKELAYVQEGSGKVVVNNIEHNLKTGDLVLIEPNETFYWDGEMTLHISCTPVFTPEQHVYIDETVSVIEA